MIVVQSMVAAIAVGLVLGFVGLYRTVLARFATLQAELAQLRSDMARLMGDAEDGEMLRALRDLRAVQQRDEAQRETRRQADDRYATLSDESRWDRDWKSAFESDR